jgi:N-acetylmuramic acid 6-phosphate etherase
MRECVARGDAVYGISAGGAAPFVIGGLAAATSAGAYTVAIVNVANSPLAEVANETIELATGPEVLTGSTRLKAGTSQKIALNTISTAIMVRLGKVHGNKMVDVVAANRKLHERAIRLVESIAEVDRERAIAALERSDGRVKIAIVCERRNVDPVTAAELLERAGGMLRPLL